MEAFVARILSSSKKRLFGSKPIFEPYATVSEQDIATLEQSLNCSLPAGLKIWLLHAGYGDFNEELSFRKEWFCAVGSGPLKNDVIFAQDILGNLYSFSPKSGCIHFVSRSVHEFSLLANDFTSFLEELEKRNFKVQVWVESEKAIPYA